MQNVSVTSHVNASPDAVWQTIGDPATISGWHPAIAASSLDGDVRLCTLENGAAINEKVVNRDDAGRNYSYIITDSPLPLTDYKATISVSEEGSGSAVEWTCSFQPAGAPDEEVVGLITGVYQAGFAALRQQFPG